jgi:hypothetical protein
MTSKGVTARELAIDLVNAWVGMETLGGVDGNDEEYEAAVERYIDLTAFDHRGLGLPEEVESNELRSSFVLINYLNDAIVNRGLEDDDLEIARDALAAAMKVLANRVGVDLPPGF